jgi:hypothetical protein
MGRRRNTRDLTLSPVAPDCGVLQFEVLVSVQYMSRPSDANDIAPFAAETIYATGGLVLTKMERMELKDPSDSTAAPDPFAAPSELTPKPQPRISLVSDVEVHHGPLDTASSTIDDSAKFRIRILFKKITNHTPRHCIGKVRAWLFGQDRNLVAKA